jgi:hypothetical protein
MSKLKELHSLRISFGPTLVSPIAKEFAESLLLSQSQWSF